MQTRIRAYLVDVENVRLRRRREVPIVVRTPIVRHPQPLPSAINTEHAHVNHNHLHFYQKT